MQTAFLETQTAMMGISGMTVVDKSGAAAIILSDQQVTVESVGSSVRAAAVLARGEVTTGGEQGLARQVRAPQMLTRGRKVLVVTRGAGLPHMAAQHWFPTTPNLVPLL